MEMQRRIKDFTIFKSKSNIRYHVLILDFILLIHSMVILLPIIVRQIMKQITIINYTCTIS